MRTMTTRLPRRRCYTRSVPADTINPAVVQAMAELGLDLS
jgi:hypothetical protein